MKRIGAAAVVLLTIAVLGAWSRFPMTRTKAILEPHAAMAAAAEQFVVALENAEDIAAIAAAQDEFLDTFWDARLEEMDAAEAWKDAMVSRGILLPQLSAHPSYPEIVERRAEVRAVLLRAAELYRPAVVPHIHEAGGELLQELRRNANKVRPRSEDGRGLHEFIRDDLRMELEENLMGCVSPVREDGGFYPPFEEKMLPYLRANPWVVRIMEELRDYLARGAYFSGGVIPLSGPLGRDSYVAQELRTVLRFYRSYPFDPVLSRL